MNERKEQLEKLVEAGNWLIGELERAQAEMTQERDAHRRAYEDLFGDLERVIAARKGQD